MLGAWWGDELDPPEEVFNRCRNTYGDENRQCIRENGIVYGCQQLGGTDAEIRSCINFHLTVEGLAGKFVTGAAGGAGKVMAVAVGGSAIIGAILAVALL